MTDELHFVLFSLVVFISRIYGFVVLDVEQF